MNRGDIGLFLLRFGAGTLILGHGWGKAARLLAGETAFADPIGIGPLPSLVLATFAELVCALLVIAGLKTRLAAVPLVINMLVAALVHHAPDPWGKKELPLLYAIAFLTLVFTGGGRYAFDALLAGRRGRSRRG